MRVPGRPKAVPDLPTVFLHVGANHWEVFAVWDACGAALDTLFDASTVSRMAQMAAEPAPTPAAETRDR